MSEFRPEFHLLRVEEVIAGAEFAPSLESRSQPQLRSGEKHRSAIYLNGRRRALSVPASGQICLQCCWCAIHMPQRNLNKSL